MELHVTSWRQVHAGEATYVRTRFFFPADQAPADYAEV